jgi:hypothetical protein
LTRREVVLLVYGLFIPAPKLNFFPQKAMLAANDLVTLYADH